MSRVTRESPRVERLERGERGERARARARARRYRGRRVDDFKDGLVHVGGPVSTTIGEDVL